MIPFNLRPPLEKWRKESQDHDLIEHVANTSTECVSGAVVVPKPKNPDEIRVFGDYRRVNEAIKREYHPMPTIEELTDDMSGAAYFSRLDLRSGYHQIALKEESRGLTAFTTHSGLFQWKGYLLESMLLAKYFRMPSNRRCKVYMVLETL